jgi:hypothetical protein
MGTLKDLLGKPLHELTDSELEERINLLRHLRVITSGQSRAPRSNKERRLDDLIKKLPKEQLEKLMLLLKEEKE